MSDARAAQPGFVTDEVVVRVPATSANLGPGFDTLGLALDLVDEVRARVLPEPDRLEIEVEGEGADVARDATHLVHRAVAAGLDALGRPLPGLRLRCRNVVPHGRGLGSSAAAIVSGLAAARALVAREAGEVPWSDAALLDLAAGLEGHPDNVAPAVLGGFTVAVSRDTGCTAVRLPVHDDVRVRALVPPEPVSTSVARGLLPAQVPHADAAHNAGRAALLVAALTAHPELLLEATDDRLHQSYREPALPESLAVVERLRAQGHAAVVSGAGPTVLVLSRATAVEALDAVLPEVVPPGWRTLPLRVADGVASSVVPTAPGQC